MKKHIKDQVLNCVAAVGHKAAATSYDWPSWWGMHQPEKPEALKKLKNK